MTTATWNGVTLAESGETVVIEGNHYFPRTAIHEEYFQPSETTSICPWKGEASYFDIKVEDQINSGAAWYYPEPKPAAAEIAGYVAFWKGVRVED